MPRTVRLGPVSLLEDRITPAVAGDLDPLFGAGGIATVSFPLPPTFTFGTPTPTASAVAVQPDGRVVLAGTVPSVVDGGGTDFAVVRLLINGQLDPTFGGGLGSVTIPLDLGGSNNDTAHAVAIQPDGKIVVAGSASTDDAGLDFAVVRLNADGSPDGTFGTGGVVTVPFTSTQAVVSDDVAYAVAIQPDEKIVLAGSARFDFAAARLNPDGTLDATFGTKGKATIVYSAQGFQADAARAVALQPDGKIILAGYADGAGFQYDFAVVRLNENGGLDGTFGNKGRASIGFDLGGFNADKAYGVALQSDGRIVVVGTAEAGFGFGSNKSDMAIARLTADGLPDAEFGTGGQLTIGLNLGGNFADEANAVLVQPDDKIVIVGSAERTATGGGKGGGGFGTTAGSFAVVRLNADGTYDTGFGTGGKVTVPVGSSMSFNAPLPGANAVAIQPDGNLVVAGTGSDAFVAMRFLGETPPEVPEPPPPPDGPSKEPILPTPVSGLPQLPGTVLAGGPANGTARVLFNPGGYGAFGPGSVLTFFPGVGVEVRTAVGDVNGDLIPDFIAGTGPGVPARVVVIDGRTGAVLASWQPFEESFTGGVFVAAADITGDGKAEVVVTPDLTGGPVVVVYSGAALTAGVRADRAEVARFLGIEDPDFRGGARAALGDVNGNGTPDLVVAAGFGGGPRVAVFDGRSVAASNPAPSRLVPDFFAFEDSLRNGAFVAAGDIDGDGFADLAFGGGPGGAPRVRVVSGRLMLESGLFTNVDQLTGTAQVGNFFAGASDLRGGVRLVLRDVDGDGRADLTVGSGEGEPSQVRVFQAASLTAAAPQPVRVEDPFGEVLPNGVFVG
jgi:uncharacterized delta-60 repeat protein